LAPPLAQCPWIALLLNVIPSYHTCFLTALHSNAFSLTYSYCRRSAPAFLVPDITVPGWRGGPAGHRLGARSARRWGARGAAVLAL